MLLSEGNEGKAAFPALFPWISGQRPFFGTLRAMPAGSEVLPHGAGCAGNEPA